MSRGSEGVDLDWVSSHFHPDDPRLGADGALLSDGLWKAVQLMLERCPVAPTDAVFVGSPQGTRIVSRYSDVMALIQDPELFSNSYQKGARDDDPTMIPLEVDPPALLEYRRLLQPYLTIKAVSKFADLARQIITELIDAAAPASRFDDVVTQLAQPFASQVQWGWLVGIDAVDQEQVLDWMLTWVHKHFEPEFEIANKAWVDWIDETIARRRNEPRRDDLIDALIHGKVQGRPLTDEEIVGVMMIMILGGVTSTSDAISNILFRLAVHPDLQRDLRADPALIPLAVEEALRIEPPVTGLSRRCTRDTVFAGEELHAGDHLFWHISSANHDPREFPKPDEFDLHRQRNRHLAFGAGHHRCIGSNFARQNLRIVLEEILGRLDDIRLIEGDPPRRMTGTAWGMARLPLAFAVRTEV